MRFFYLQPYYLIFEAIWLLAPYGAKERFKRLSYKCSAFRDPITQVAWWFEYVATRAYLPGKSLERQRSRELKNSDLQIYSFERKQHPFCRKGSFSFAKSTFNQYLLIRTTIKNYASRRYCHFDIRADTGPGSDWQFLGKQARKKLNPELYLLPCFSASGKPIYAGKSFCASSPRSD